MDFRGDISTKPLPARVLMINGLRTCGGEERVVLDLANSLIQRGIQVAIACDKEADSSLTGSATLAKLLHVRLKGKESLGAIWQLRR